MSYASASSEDTHTEAEAEPEAAVMPAVEEGAVAEAVVDERTEPVTDPDAWHFTKGEVVALMEHMQEWVKWYLAYGKDQPEPKDEPVIEPAREA